MRLAERLRRRAVRLLAGDDESRADGVCRQPPEWLVLVVNNFCNLRCRMCDVGVDNEASVFYEHLVGRAPRNMDVALLETVLGQAGAFAVKPRVGFAYTEPLLHPRIVDLCRATAGRGFRLSVTTNGFLLPRLADELTAAGVDEITVSVDGTEEVHDAVRGRAGSYAALRDGIEALHRAKRARRVSRPALSLSYTLTDDNYRALPAFVRAAEALAPESLSVSHPNFVTAEMAAAHNAAFGAPYQVAVSNVGPMDLAGIDVGALWDALTEAKAWARARSMRLTVVPDAPTPRALETYYREPAAFVGGRRCSDPWRMLMVRTDGAVVPAHGRCYDVPLGNVADTPLASLWNAEPARRFRRDLRAAGGTLPACARCCGVIGKPIASAV